MAGVEAHARVALLLGMMEMPGERADAVEGVAHVLRLALQLLHPHTIDRE